MRGRCFATGRAYVKKHCSRSGRCFGQMYRDATFIDRCFCEEPVSGPCRCCARPRCRNHLARGLCARCTRFLERELEKHASSPWLFGGVAGVATTLALLVAGVGASIAVGLPVALVAGIAFRRGQPGRAIRALAPRMAATKGELPRDVDADDPTIPKDHVGQPVPGSDV